MKKILFIAITLSSYIFPETMEERFKEIYYKQTWGPGYLSTEFGGSGGGSTVEGTNDIRQYLTELLYSKPDVRTFLDVGCGEAIWQMMIPWETLGIKYIGVDVFQPIIEINQRIWKDSPNVTFNHVDGYIDPLPKADVCFIKDVLQHWDLSEIQHFIQKIRDDYKYIFIMNGKYLLNIETANLAPYQFIKEFSDSGEVKFLYLILPSRQLGPEK
jgi:hypothetical protein